jgi:hypothetical protein
MEEELKEATNQELIQIYRLIKEHLEYLEKEKQKVEENEEK